MRSLPILLSLVSVTASFRTQSAAAEGILLCHGKPASGVKVKMYDDDSGPDLDDLLDEGYTDAAGRFKLSGSASEFLTIDVKLNIYHKCDKLIPACDRRITMWVPDGYVSSGSIPQKVFNVGTLELSAEFEGETTDCMNK